MRPEKSHLGDVGRSQGPRTMSNASDYAVVEHLRTGQVIKIHALRSTDAADMLAAVSKTSPQSLQRRFFVTKRGFSEKEIEFFLNIDFSGHVALVALADEDEKSIIVGGGRYVVVEPGRAELAFIVIDAWQGRGIGSLLIKHLIGIARDAGLNELIAEVLHDNTPMLKVFGKFGFAQRSARDPGVVHVALKL
jgi:GNAT superfamily N-acetyltransferase